MLAESVMERMLLGYTATFDLRRPKPYGIKLYNEGTSLFTLYVSMTYKAFKVIK